MMASLWVLVVPSLLLTCLLAGGARPSDLHVAEKQLFLARVSALATQLGLGETLVREFAVRGLVADTIAASGEVVRAIRVQPLGETGSFQATALSEEALPWGREYCYSVRGQVEVDQFPSASSSWTWQREAVGAGSCRQLQLRSDPRPPPGPVGGWAAAGSPEVNNGSQGLRELLSLAVKTDCSHTGIGKCKRGTVTMDTWVNETLTFQRWLARNTPLNQIQMLGTHNSFNDKADGYGTGDFLLGKLLELVSGGKWEFVWAQQWFTMTDQLAMGYRHLMLDPDYFWGAMRLCHCGSISSLAWLDKVIQELDKLFNTTIHFSAHDLGCLPSDRLLSSGLQEIADWAVLPGHQNEVLMISINDEGHAADWGKLSLIQGPVKEAFGALLFTPQDKQAHFPNTWPTPNQLVALGKRVIVTCTSRCMNDYIFADMMVPSWDKDTMKYFTPYPKCGGYTPGQWYLVGGESQTVGPIYNGPAAEGLVTTDNLPALLQCPLSVVEMDIASPGLVSAATWSWAEGFSVKNLSNKTCAAMSLAQQGHWVTLPCNSSLPHACYNSTTALLSITNQTAPWDKPACPSNSLFFLPAVGYQNWQLFQLLAPTGASFVWLNLPPSAPRGPTDSL